MMDVSLKNVLELNFASVWKSIALEAIQIIRDTLGGVRDIVTKCHKGEG